MTHTQPSRIRRAFKVSRLRLISQTASLIVIYLGLTGLVKLIGTSLLSNGLVLPVYACWYPQGRTVTCFIWSIQTAIFPILNPRAIAIIIGLFIGMTILVGRFWCGWICPMGFVEDLEARLRHQVLRVKNRKISDGMNRNLGQLRYVILAVFLTICFLVGSELFIATFGKPFSDNFAQPFCQVCPIKPLFVFLQSSILGVAPQLNVGLV